MTETEKLWATVSEWRHDRLAIATVISTWGSAPRPRGSHMLINADGRFEGSVSGGCVEGDILHMAASVIANGVSQLRSYGVTNDDAWEVGLPCGGEITILIQPVGDLGFPLTLLKAAAEAGAAGRHFTVSTNVESGTSQAGENPGTFINTYRPPRRLVIIGAVQIAQSLSAIAQQAGIAPVIVDPRGRFLTPERFPGVDLDDRWPDEAIAALKPDSATAVVTLSHDPKIDDPGLAAALRAPTGYIAALGSRKSHAARLGRLSAEGFPPEELARIDGPAGMDINAIGPAEIAVSICAGMIRALNGLA